MKEDVKQILTFAVKCPLSNIRQAAARIELLNSGGAKKVRSMKCSERARSTSYNQRFIVTARVARVALSFGGLLARVAVIVSIGRKTF